MTDKNIHVALTFDYDAMSVWIGSIGAMSPSMVSRGEFGAIAVRRVLEVLREHDVKATFFVPGHTALAFPQTVIDIAADGHEIGHHGWVHENPVSLTSKEERWIMNKGLDALDRVAGVRPVGYRSPAWDNSPNTIPLLLEYGFKYESSLMGNEYEAYWCRVGDEWNTTDAWKFGKPVDLVELPVSWMLDDFPHFELIAGANSGHKSPRDLLQVWIDEFDYLYEKIGSGIFNVTMHPQTIGRGARMLVLEGLIKHIKAKRGVKFGTCADYAEKWRVGKTPSLPRDAAA